MLKIRVEIRNEEDGSVEVLRSAERSTDDQEKADAAFDIGRAGLASIFDAKTSTAAKKEKKA